MLKDFFQYFYALTFIKVIISGKERKKAEKSVPNHISLFASLEISKLRQRPRSGGTIKI
jgi:hypothetical protein